MESKIDDKDLLNSISRILNSIKGLRDKEEELFMLFKDWNRKVKVRKREKRTKPNPIDSLIKDGWTIKEKDVYADTGDLIYVMYKIFKGKAVIFKVIICEVENERKIKKV